MAIENINENTVSEGLDPEAMSLLFISGSTLTAVILIGVLAFLRSKSTGYDN